MSYNTSIQARILIIEDDASINEVVTAFLTKKGFDCTQAYSGSEARLVLQGATVPFDLVITDLMLPGLSGQELVKLIRVQQHVPIIVTSALDAPEQKVDLFELGADDYLTKPFDLHELYARVEVQLRHAGRAGKSAGVENGSETTILETAAAQGVNAGGKNTHSDDALCIDASTNDAGDAATTHSSNQAVLSFKKWTLNPESHQFLVAGEPVKLTRLEYNIVETLMRRPTKVFTKQELFERAWSEECFIEEKAINVHISNIRSKLKASQTHEYIETVWGIGFKLAAE